MITRRSLGAGAIGALSSAVLTSGDPTHAEVAPAVLAGDEVELLTRINGRLSAIDSSLGVAFVQNSLATGTIARVREQFTLFLRTNGKFPDYCEIGPQVFYDVYDWHVRHRQPIDVSLQQQGRLALRFMFTLLILRHDQTPTYIADPYDLPRG